MGVRPDAPTNEVIGSPPFYRIIKDKRIGIY
jgi:hypothetical protein